MKEQEAGKYPLFKDYEFGLHIEKHGGSGTLLIPRKGIYVPREYGFGSLRLAPYLQEVFNEGRSINVWELTQELESEEEIGLTALDLNSNGNKQPFLYSILNRYVKHDVVKRNGLQTIIEFEDDLSAGQNWDKTRVCKMESNKPNTLDFSEIENLKR